MDLITLGLSKNYVDQSLKGAGALKGEKGDKGDKGETGMDGKSAYSYALDAGYNGTEEEFAQRLVSDTLLYTPQELTEEQQAQARENIGAVNIEEVEELLGIEEEFNVTGDLVELDLGLEPGTEINVVSKIHRDSTWGESNKLVLHQVSGINFIDVSAYFGGAGKVHEKNGMTAVVNEDCTVTVSGTNSSTTWTKIPDFSAWNSECGKRIYPAGTYKIPQGLSLQIRKAQYPEAEAITGATGNLTGTFTSTEPFKIVSLYHSIAGGKSEDVTIKLGISYNETLPEVGFEYTGNIYTVTFDRNIYDGEYNWTTGELKDVDGNTVAYYDSQSITTLPGVNYLWTGFGENIVSNKSNTNLEKVIIRLDEPAPDETVSSICDFKFIPTTPQASYCLHSDKVRNGGMFNGHEIPLVTSKGDLSVVASNGEVISKKYVNSLINWQGVSDALTNKGIHKVWSDKFYFTKEPVSQEEFSYSDGAINGLHTFEFTEEDFQNIGMPAKLDNIPIASPCFYTGSDAASKLNSRVYGDSIFPATFSWDGSSNKYIFKIRGMYVNYIMAQLQKYTKAYFHYQLETPYDEETAIAVGVSSGDMVTFTVDDSDWKTYLDEKLYKDASSKNITTVDATPTVVTHIPRNVVDACDGMINAARMLNNTGKTGGDATVQGYSWIGEGDNTTDYTTRLQSKLDELHTVSNGGTINLGPGTYPISKNLIVYDNTCIIGCGTQTTIKQTADNTDAIVLNGSNITLKDFNINLAGACTETTACVYANSNNSDGKDGFPTNTYVSNLTMDNIFMSGKYRFEYADDGKPTLGDVYNNYKGVGIRSSSLFFNYAHVDNVHGKYLMAVVDNGGGSCYYNITSEFCKYAIYTGGVNNTYFIDGHSYYAGNNTDGYVSMSDEIIHDESGHNNKYSASLYDIQHFKHYVYFGGRSQSNSYALNTNCAGAYLGPIHELSAYNIHQYVIDLGRGNIRVASHQNIPFAIGNATKQLSGLTSMQFSDPTIRNALSGAGVWGNISSNVDFVNQGLELSEICRYPSERARSVSDTNLPSIVSSVAASEDAPIEIIIDISNRPINAQIGYFIQFDHRYVASDFTVSCDTTNDGTYNTSYQVTDNTDVTTFRFTHQSRAYLIYRIKFTFTKPLQIENFTYQDAAYRDYTIDYNPDGLIGICNIGMTVNDYAGRSFLGECGGSLYGDVDMHQNTLKNLPAPVDNGDAVSKSYLEERLTEVGNGGSSGLTTEEKNLIFSLFQDAAYTKPLSGAIEQLAELWGIPLIWQKVIPLEDLYTGYSLGPTKIEIDGELKYAIARDTRVSYLDFIQIKAGATYKFEWEGAEDSLICIEANNSASMQEVAGGWSYSDADRWSSGWNSDQTTGCQITIPTEHNGKPIVAMRFTFNSSSPPTGDITITEVVD